MTVLTLEELLIAEGMPVFPYTETYCQAKHEPFDTPGFTGHPEPVLRTYDTLAHHGLFLSAPLLLGKALSLQR